MVLLRCILSAALATSVAVAVNLPLQRRAAVSTGATIIETGDGRQTHRLLSTECAAD